MEARGRKRSDEPAQFAVRLVRSTVGNHGRVVHQSAGHLPDFRIDYNDGRVAIGEVAAHVDPAVQSLWAEAAKHDHLCALQAGLGIWRVWLSKDASVKRVSQRAA